MLQNPIFITIRIRMAEGGIYTQASLYLGYVLIKLFETNAALQNQNFSGRHFEQMSNRRNHTRRWFDEF